MKAAQGSDPRAAKFHLLKHGRSKCGRGKSLDPATITEADAVPAAGRCNWCWGTVMAGRPRVGARADKAAEALLRLGSRLAVAAELEVSAPTVTRHLQSVIATSSPVPWRYEAGTILDAEGDLVATVEGDSLPNAVRLFLGDMG